MKKKIILSIFATLAVVGITGCGKNSNDEEIMEYLNTNFPNETFEIVNKEYVENVESNCQSDNDDDKNEGHKYKIISNTTNIEFEINDIREESSYGTCEYALKNDYYEQALTKYILEFNDSRIELYTGLLDANIKVEYNNFKSIDELSNVLYNFKNYYENKYPFNNKETTVSAFIYNSNNYVGSVDLSFYNKEIDLNYIKNNLNELF